MYGSDQTEWCAFFSVKKMSIEPITYTIFRVEKSLIFFQPDNKNDHFKLHSDAHTIYRHEYAAHIQLTINYSQLSVTLFFFNS